MEKIEAVYRKAMGWLTGSSLFVCFVVVFASSLSRYAFNAPFQWSEELAKFSMIYGTVFGAAYAYLSGTQVRFSVFLYLIPKRLARWIGLVSDIAILVLGVALTISGFIFMMKRGGIMASGLGVKMYYPQAAMMLGGACLFFAALIRVGDQFLSAKSETEETAP
jgi:TRAP-type C4-dicarboxylate transport system permease small subunit